MTHTNASDYEIPSVAAQAHERKAARNRERQAAFRERMKSEGKRQHGIYVTEDEAFYLERVLKTMRETGGVPATLRDDKGKMIPVDL